MQKDRKRIKTDEVTDGQKGNKYNRHTFRSIDLKKRHETFLAGEATNYQISVFSGDLNKHTSVVE